MPKVREYAIFGGVVGLVLLALSWVIQAIFGSKTVPIQFSLIEQPLKVAVPSGQGLGEKFLGYITQPFGFQTPDMVSGILVAIIGGAIVGIIGSYVYTWIHRSPGTLMSPKSKTGVIALVFFYGGLIGGLILSFLGGGSGAIKLPAWGTAITLAVNSVVTAAIVLWILPKLKLQRFEPSL